MGSSAKFGYPRKSVGSDNGDHRLFCPCARWPSLRASTVETTPDPRNIVCEEKRGEAIRTASPAGLLRSLRLHVSAQPVFPGDAPFFRVSLPVMMRKLDVADKFRTGLLLDPA